MDFNNTTPEEFDGGNAAQESLSQEQILMSESDILRGLFDLGKGKDDTESYRKIQIKRKGALKLEFRVRPITEDENQICWRQATKYAPTKPGQPKTAIDTDVAKYRSFVIYTATVDEDRSKVWDNKRAQDALGILQGVDMIDRVLFAGEKGRVFDIIDEISDKEEEIEELARD